METKSPLTVSLVDDEHNFRKKILQMKLLKETGALQENVSHRPAKLFQFDKERYEILQKKGFNFEV